MYRVRLLYGWGMAGARVQVMFTLPYMSSSLVKHYIGLRPPWMVPEPGATYTDWRSLSSYPA
eukprot:7363789-Pyramimonas_sp.AAC.1